MNVQSLSEINAAYAAAINEIQERTGSPSHMWWSQPHRQTMGT